MIFNETDSLNYHGQEVKFYTPTKKTAGRVRFRSTSVPSS